MTKFQGRFPLVPTKARGVERGMKDGRDDTVKDILAVIRRVLERHGEARKEFEDEIQRMRELTGRG